MLPKFTDLKVLVVGDAILDEYVYGKVERISPEAPVPVLAQDRNELKLGGAANVAANCAALGASTTLFSITGIDKAATTLEQMCEQKKIHPWFVKSEKIYTPRKTRFVAGNHQMLRVDKESKEVLNEKELKLLKLIPKVEEADVVIVSDYNKGCISEKIMDWLKSYHSRIVVDPKPVNSDLYQGVSLVTPNKKEAAEILGILPDVLDDQHIEFLGFKLGSNVLVTLGEDGMKFCECGSRPVSFPAVAQEVFDVTGAGDTVIAVVSLAIASGMEMKVACELANKAAAQVVAKFGTATVNPSTLEFYGGK